MVPKPAWAFVWLGLTQDHIRGPAYNWQGSFCRIPPPHSTLLRIRLSKSFHSCHLLASTHSYAHSVTLELAGRSLALTIHIPLHEAARRFEPGIFGGTPTSTLLGPMRTPRYASTTFLLLLASLVSSMSGRASASKPDITHANIDNGHNGPWWSRTLESLLSITTRSVQSKVSHRQVASSIPGGQESHSPETRQAPVQQGDAYERALHAHYAFRESLALRSIAPAERVPNEKRQATTLPDGDAYERALQAHYAFRESLALRSMAVTDPVLPEKRQITSSQTLEEREVITPTSSGPGRRCKRKDGRCGTHKAKHGLSPNQKAHHQHVSSSKHHDGAANAKPHKAHTKGKQQFAQEQVKQDSSGKSSGGGDTQGNSHSTRPCFPSLDFHMPSDVPASTQDWWCPLSQQHAFVSVAKSAPP